MGFSIRALLVFISCLQFGYGQQSTNPCKKDILTYLEDMETVLAPIAGQVYYMKYSTHTEFSVSENIPASFSETEMLMTSNKVVLDDESMKVYGDDKNIFVVLPKIRKIYWNNSDPKLFKENNAQKQFLDIEKILLKDPIAVNCSSANGFNIVTIIPNKDFEKKFGLTKQVLKYNLKSKRVVEVENRFGKNSKVKKQVVSYEVIDYKSSKKIKKPLEYIFNESSLKPKYKGFEIIDNRSNK